MKFVKPIFFLQLSILSSNLLQDPFMCDIVGFLLVLLLRLMEVVPFNLDMFKQPLPHIPIRNRRINYGISVAIKVKFESNGMCGDW